MAAIAAGWGFTLALKSDGVALAPELKIEGNQANVSLKLKVILGRKYQLQASKDLKVWTVTGPDFVADSENLSQEFVVAEVGSYFRLVEVP